MRICVFGAASPSIDKEYIEKVEAFGRKLVERGHSLVFGGGGNGLMGAAARGVHEANGHIIGVIPKFFREEKIERIFEHCDELIEPDTMRERKQIMDEHADAFVIVPGGIGTYEEFFEILTSKQLCRHNKPIAIYNINNYYDDIDFVMRNAIKKKFVTEKCLSLYLLSQDLDEVFNYIEAPIEKMHIKELKEG